MSDRREDVDVDRRAAGRRPLALAAVLCAALSLSGGPSRAQQAPVFGDTADERAAYEDYRNNRLLTARTKAQRVLEHNEDSIVANFVMGAVLHEAEGLPSRAMHYLARARAIYEQRYGANRTPSAPWRLHEEILFATQRLAGELEEHSFRLQILEYHDALYDPPLLSQRAMTLMRLGRFNEARQKAQEAMRQTDAEQRLLGHNALCAIETEAGQRQPRFDACSRALEAARARPVQQGETSPRIAVYAYNAAEAAYSVYRLEDVERFATEATRRIEFTPANPWRLLARRYMDGGRIPEAVNAIRDMQRWRAAQPAFLRDQDRAESDSALATLLLLAGEPEIGLRFADRAMERPDRRGLVSSKPEQALGAHALLRRALLRSAAEVEREVASVTPGLAVQRRLRSWSHALRSWPDDERVVSVLADDDRLVATVRGYVGGGLEPLPSWMVGDLITVLGPGVFAAALAEAREKDASNPGSRPYHDGLAAELALVRGEYDEAVRLARGAAQALPRGEVMLAARVLAVGAEAARRGGDASASRALFEQAMTKDPGVVRRMGYAIPAVVRVEGTGDAAATRAVELLRGSPRLREEQGAFVVTVASSGARAYTICLKTTQGDTVQCVAVSPGAPNESVDGTASRIGSVFHREVFASRTGFATIDLRSLDGTTTGGRDNAREALRGLMSEVQSEGPETTR
jgi:tetratricopeptide (TPR) repeat protein